MTSENGRMKMKKQQLYQKMSLYSHFSQRKKGSEYKTELHKLTSSAFPIVCSLAGYQKKTGHISVMSGGKEKGCGPKKK